MRLSELMPASIPPAAANDVEIRGLAADSRDVGPGYLFAALPGTRACGTDFIPEAAAHGAAAVLAPEGTDPALASGLALVTDPNPRLRLALASALFYGTQPAVVVCVTGTNGKTSVADFTRQIWRACGRKAASLGTLGTCADGEWRPLRLTTPDPIALHRVLAELSEDGIDHLALEASSHGLAQYRLDGVRVAAAAFTNVTRDHMDYHADSDAYFTAKASLFERVMAADGTAVLNADDARVAQLAARCRARGQRVLTYGKCRADLQLLARHDTEAGQDLSVAIAGAVHAVALPLPGAFQAHNALAALGLALATGVDAEAAVSALGRVDGVPGRLQPVTGHPAGAAIFVDYAHTPDALAAALGALRPLVPGTLAVVFGCGGERDVGKRREMGEIAARLADRAIVTDDNPRRENPAAIRRAILDACPGAVEIGDRARAIRTAIERLGVGDGLLIAGKGHEREQIVGERAVPFDDVGKARCAVAGIAGGQGGMGGPSNVIPLWTSAEAAAATGGRVPEPWIATGVSIDSRSVEAGDLFVALAGPNHDGHDFVGAAFDRSAAAAMVSRRPEARGDGTPLLLVVDTFEGLRTLAARARERSTARVVAITGSVGKTGTKELLAGALGSCGPTHASAGNLNNHIGAPLSLARLPQGAAFGVFEAGMNHPGEIAPLSRLIRPHIALITTIAPAHTEAFTGLDAVADAKAEIFQGLEPGGTAVLNRDNAYFDRLAATASAAGAGRIVSFGEGPEADARLLAWRPAAVGGAVTALIDGDEIGYDIAYSGRHWALNSVAVLAVVQAAGAPVARAAAALHTVAPGAGRGVRHRIPLSGGHCELIDESYNASPAAVRAAIATLGEAAPPAPGGRRVAVLGDMLELGDEAARWHADLADDLEAAGIDLVFTAGSLMANLHRAVDPARRGVHAPDSESLVAILRAEIRAGDVVLVKGSLGSRMGRIVRRLADHAADASSAGRS